MPAWYDFLPDWLNPWATPAPAAAPAPAPTRTEPPAVTAPPGDLGQLAAEPEPEKAKPNLVYLGLNDPSRAAEIAALPEGATVVDGSTKQGTVMAADGKTELDLARPEHVQQFLREAGVAERRKNPDGTMETEEQAKQRLAKLAATFGGGMPAGIRDEMAELVQTLQKVENGELAMERLIISGHHYQGEMGIHGPHGAMTFQTLAAVMSQFPGARDGVEDLMFSACNTVNGPQAQADVYQKLFPGLDTTWGYNGIAPAPGEDAKNSSPAHIAAWEAASRGEDPALIEAAAKQRFRAKVARY